MAEQLNVGGKTIDVPDNKLEEEVICAMKFEDLLEYSEQKKFLKQQLNSEKKLSRAREKRMRSILQNRPADGKLDDFDPNIDFTNVNIKTMIDRRANEIEMCERAVLSRPEKTAIVQRLPFYMRRRMMSHNPKRIPAFARKELMVPVNIAESKKEKYKKHRKLKMSRGKMYINRQSRFRWLESHVWHAKRFHMVEKWGFKLADFCNDKILRALHRDIQIKSAVCDTSYYGWIELQGEQKTILGSLVSISNPNVGLTFAATEYLSGLKEGQTFIFMPESYPMGCIGPVNFIWKPPENNEDVGKTKDEKLSVNVKRTIWISFHPAMKYAFLSALEKVISQNIVFRNLSGALNTIELYGHNSLKFLKKCLQFSNVDLDYDEKFIFSNKTRQAVKVKKSFWWSKLYSESDEMKNLIKFQAENWKSLKEKDVSQGQIFGFLARDPRLAFRPNSASNETDRNVTNDKSELCNLPLSHSFIWDCDVRDYIMTRKMSNRQVQSYLSNHLPLTHVQTFDEEARIPILVIRKTFPNSHCSEFKKNMTNSEYRTVWKLVIPRNWFMPFWLMLKRLNLRVFGLRERDRFLHRAGFAVFPNDYMDSVIGQFCFRQLCNDLCLKLKRRPPSKRFCCERFGIINPFTCDISKLFECDEKKKFNLNFDTIIKDSLKNEELLNPVIKHVKIEAEKHSNSDGRKRKIESNEMDCSEGAKKAKLEMAPSNPPPEIEVETECRGKVMFSKTDFPINCSDLSECVNLPFLKTMTIAELDMAVNELMSYAPSFVKENPIVPFYVLRDRSVLLQLQEFVIDPKRSARKQPYSHQSSKAKKRVYNLLQPHFDSGLIMVNLKIRSGIVPRVGSVVCAPSLTDFYEQKIAKAPPKRIERRKSKKQKKAKNQKEQPLIDDNKADDSQKSETPRLEDQLQHAIETETKKKVEVKQEAMDITEVSKVSGHEKTKHPGDQGKLSGDQNDKNVSDIMHKNLERVLIGYVLYSEYDLTVGHVTATAICNLKRLVDLIVQSDISFVFVANIEGKYYYPAQFELCFGTGV